MLELINYKDFNFNFKSHPVTNDLLVVKNEDAIKQSIKALLLTNRGERLFNSKIGTNLREILFEPLDFASASSVKDEIFRCLSNFEPRITIQTLEVIPNDREDGYDVILIYGINSRDNRIVEVDFFLDRTR